MVVNYQAKCNMHPDYQAEKRDQYADADSDLRQHIDEQHKAEVITIEEADE